MEEERRLCYVGMTRAREEAVSELGALPAAIRRRTAGSVDPLAIPEGSPAALLERVRGDQGHVDLYAERYEVRETPSGTFILGRLTTRWRTSSSSFRERGMPAPQGLERRRPAAAGASVSSAGGAAVKKREEIGTRLDH